MPETNAERLVALRDYAIKLYDKGDGRGVDWSQVGALCFGAGFSCLKELPPDDQGLHTVARRAHDAAYGLMTGSPDSATPYTADRPERPPFSPDPEPRPGYDHDLRR